MKRNLLLIGFQLLAFWPVISWYFARVLESSDQMWGFLALITALGFLLVNTNPTADLEYKPVPTVSIVLLLLYIFTYPVLPPLARATIAVITLGVTASTHRRKSIDSGIVGLLILSLPIIPSLQFFLGYPLRLLVATVAAPVLRLGGFAVVQEGTCLNWAGQLIWIDAPCSGIRMLWVGLYLALTLICLFQIRRVKALLCLTSAFLVIVAGNIFRAVALFYIEAKVLDTPPWVHDYTGVVAFLITALGILALTHLLRKEKLCAAQVVS